MFGSFFENLTETRFRCRRLDTGAPAWHFRSHNWTSGIYPANVTVWMLHGGYETEGSTVIASDEAALRVFRSPFYACPVRHTSRHTCFRPLNYLGLIAVAEFGKHSYFTFPVWPQETLRTRRANQGAANVQRHGASCLCEIPTSG